MSATTSGDDRPIRLAIVEDDASYRRSLGRLCRLLGFDARAFASGAEFLAALDDTEPRFDCMLIDKMMPVMTGLELHAILLDLGQSVPTVLITGDADSRTMSSCAVAGLIACLEKPIDAELLSSVVLQAAGRLPATR